jgi:hypothetical protein
MFRKRRARKGGATARQAITTTVEDAEEADNNNHLGSASNATAPVPPAAAAAAAAAAAQTSRPPTTTQLPTRQPVISFQGDDDDDDAVAAEVQGLSLERRKARQRREAERNALRKRRPLAPLPPSAPSVTAAQPDDAAARYSASNLEELRREALANQAEAAADAAAREADEADRVDIASDDPPTVYEEPIDTADDTLSADALSKTAEDEEDAALLERVAQAKASRRLAVVQAQRTGGAKDPKSLVQMQASFTEDDEERGRRVRAALEIAANESEQVHGDGNEWEEHAIRRGVATTDKRSSKARSSDIDRGNSSSLYSDDAEYTAVHNSLTSALAERKAKVQAQQQALSRATSNCDAAKAKRGGYEGSVQTAKERYVFLQSTKEIVVGLSACLRAKTDMIAQIQQVLAQIESEEFKERHYTREVRVIDGIADAEDRGEIFVRGDAGGLPENVLDSIRDILPTRQRNQGENGNLPEDLPEADDEFGRRRTFASSRERSIRRRQNARRLAVATTRRRVRAGVSSDELSLHDKAYYFEELHTSDDDSETESDKRTDRRKSIAQARELVFRDVVPDLADMSTTIARFAEWKRAYPKGELVHTLRVNLHCR